MKYDVKTNGSVSNGVNDSMDFKIGDAAVLIDILRNRLYSDKIRVVVQEYLSNSRDAMREAKNTKDRIEVTLPTNRKPVLSIRDYGPGLSQERVGEVFVQFGKSTKRASETQTGGFGIGGKSAFAYTDSFTVISICNGVETHYVAHLGKNSVGSLDKVYEGKTTNKSGVEIQIGVNKTEENGETDIAKFNSMVYRTIAFWNKEEMPNVVNAHDADACNWFKLHDALERGEGFHCDKAIMMKNENTSDWANASVSLVIDGIVYDLDENHDSPQLTELEQTAKGKLYLQVPAGMVEISASRESIAVNQANFKALNGLMAKATLEIKKTAEKMISKVETIEDAKTTLQNLSLVSSSARKVVKQVEGIKIDFENGSFSETGFRGLNIGGYRRRKSAEWGVAYLNAYYMYNDSSLADSTLETKAKTIHESDSTKQFVILPKEMSEQAKILNAIPVSSLRAERQTVEKKALPEGKVNVRVFKSWGDRTEFEHVDMDDTNGVTYVLIENADNSETMHKYLALQKLINKMDGSAKFAFPSRATMKVLKGKPNFITESDFFKDAKTYIGASAFNNMVSLLKSIHVQDAQDNYRAIYDLKTSAKDIADEKFAKHFKAIKDVKPRKESSKRNRYNHDDDDVNINTAKDALVKTVFDQALGEVAEVPDFIEYVKANYPSVKCFEYYGNDGDELVHYINGKYDFLNRKAA